MSSMRFYRNIGSVIWIIAAITFAIFLFGQLDMKYMLIINASVIIIEMILLILMIRKVKKNGIMADVFSAKVLIPKGKFSDTKIRADRCIFDDPIISTNPMKRGIFMICIELTDKIIEPLELSVIRMFESEISEQKLDVTHCFIAGPHILHLNVYPREKLNFKFNRDIKTKLFSVDELYTP